jgi:hypothetical protein
MSRVALMPWIFKTIIMNKINLEFNSRGTYFMPKTFKNFLRALNLGVPLRPKRKSDQQVANVQNILF